MENLVHYINSLPDKVRGTMPCFLIDICGPLLSVFGVVNVGDDSILCEPLVASVPLILFDNVGLMTMVARVCASLKAAVNCLASSNTHKVAPHGVHRCRFPYHASAIIDGRRVDIEYHERILHHVFTARVVQTGRPVVVKFAKQYGSEVHRYWAKEEFAPALLHSEELINNWIFIVMDKLELTPLNQASVDISKISGQVLKIQGRLAAAKYVHGDLRENNVLWDTGSSRVVLIDFDWAGKDGKTLYPMFMNPDIEWPEGANRPLRIAHDAHWIKLLLSGLNKNENLEATRKRKMPFSTNFTVRMGQRTWKM
ncbi:unnamed protein product [Aphanomyces euteiches]